MVIEWQRVRVRRELRQHWVEKDAEVWTPALEREEAFLGKEVWLGDDGREVVLVIRWRSEEEWKSIPLERLEEMDRCFRAEIPDDAWELLELRSYQMA